jgi:hypothetical protein
MARYCDMTEDERRDAYNGNREAVILHQDSFAATPWRRGRAHNQAWSHMERCEREAAFIRRVAKSRGDAWAQ